MNDSVPQERVRLCNSATVNSSGDYVLYWMVAFRRVDWNFSLERAVNWSRHLGKPLLVLEALRSDYPWASDRLHSFVIQGMAEQARRLEEARIGYHPYVEQEKAAGKGLLEALAKRACVIVTDDFPCFFIPRMIAAAAEKVPVRLEKIDSNGIVPMACVEKVYSRAYDFRRFLQKRYRRKFEVFPKAHPLMGDPLPAMKALPKSVSSQWPARSREQLDNPESWLKKLPIDHSVPATDVRGGAPTAEKALRRFLEERLARYGEDRNHPEAKATSELSPWLHFGHISAHQVFQEVLDHEGVKATGISPDKIGKTENWWRLGANAQAFVDQLLTWRELGFNMCHHREDYAEFESLPEWAVRTLTDHAGDPRPQLYSLEEFESARTHDEIWNAAQTQLRREGRIHNYLRMFWGKKILHWSEHPEEALRIMIRLNDKYALDGRDPNSYSGICWCLGRYDRAWGPERPVFGKIRYMSSKSTARKLRIKAYLKKYQ